MSLGDRLYNSKAIRKFINLNYSRERDKPETIEFIDAKNKALKSFDSIYGSSVQLQKTLASDNWAKSKNKLKAIKQSNELLSYMVEKGLYLEKYEEIFDIIKLYENSLHLTANNYDNKKFSNIIYNVTGHFYGKNRIIPEDKEISEICRDNPYLILSYLNRGYSLDLNKKSNIFEKQLDKIIDESKEKSRCNLSVNEFFSKGLKFNPEKYGMDPKNRRVLFESFKADLVLNEKSSYLQDNLYFFNKELGALSEEEINEIIDKNPNNIRNNTLPQLLLSSTNLSDTNLRKLFDSFKKNDSNIKKEFSIENLRGCFTDDGQEYFLIFKHKQFNLNKEDRISIFLRAVNQNNYSFIFLNRVLSDFNNVFDGVPEPECDKIMDLLINKSIGRSIEQIRIFHALSSEYDIPLKYKEQINKLFIKEYTENNDGRLGEIFWGLKENSKEFTKHEEWLRDNIEISSNLEIDFYSNGYINDLRHFFFDVIEGKRKSVDNDLLIKKFAERIDEFNPEEYIDLFVLRKKIPMIYSEIYLKKIKDGNSLLDQLETCLRLNKINDGEYKNILIGLINNSKHSFAEKSLDLCLEKNLIKDDERKQILMNFSENIMSQLLVSGNDINDYTLEQILNRRNSSQKITDEEKTFFFNKFFNDLLKNEELNKRILEINRRDLYYFTKGFNDEKEKGDFVSRLLVSKDGQVINKLLYDFLNAKHYGIKREEITDPIISSIDENGFNTLFDHGLELNKIEIFNNLIGNFEGISKNQKESLLNKILSREDILENSQSVDYIQNFCSALSYRIMEEKHKGNKEDRVITDEDAKKISSKMFSSKYINDKSFAELISYHRSFLVSDPDILDQCVSSIQVKGSAGNCYSLLVSLEADTKPILSEIQVKNLSVKVLENQNINEDIYRMHLNSTENNLHFYLDQEVFDKNIKRITDTKLDLDLSSTIEFIILQRGIKNSNNEKKKLVLTIEQEELLEKRLLGYPKISVQNLEKIYDFDKELFNRMMDELMVQKRFPIGSICNLSLIKEEISGAYFTKINDYYFDNYNGATGVFDNICNRYAKDPVLLKEIKNKVNNLSNIEGRSIFKSKLLQNDLLSPEELKDFYEEIRSEPNVHSQVLLSAEVLGSLVYSVNPEILDKFFEAENGQARKNIEYISSFVKKYSQESKGRTIAVMLFSVEYLPERDMSEVIDRVAGSLSKFERVIEQYNYDGIPEGLRASIGMEYEITSSTSLGYNEFKNRDLKTDIVRLSQAAHIGNGRDAVHEIATRPTTNPYLLLLEMQLLHDIEYVDFNFDRSASYQKGARGYHVTIGGETGLYVNADTNFLQNSILAASWGGIHAGEIGKRVSGGRGVTLRGRSADGGNNNVKVFEQSTASVELRSLSIDKMEPFQRSIVTAFNGAIAIQALEKYTNCTSDQIYELYKSNPIANEKEFIENLKDLGRLKEGYDNDEKNMKIVYAWAELISNVKDALEYHNDEFLEGETLGYLDKDGAWVDSKDFGGSYNRSRFDSVVSSIDPTLSVAEYVNSTKIDSNKFFSIFDTDFADSLTKINNLYLKPSNKRTVKNEEGENINIGGADQANSISMLEITKLNNENLEYRNDDTYLNGTVFETLGGCREGYYAVQGGSEKMITHACQIALLNFNKKIESIVRQR